MRRAAYLVLTVVVAGVVFWATARDDTRSLVGSVGEASLSAEGGAFPVFADTAELTGPITLSDDTRRSLTPPFPSRLTFDLRLPPSATLELATAIVMMQQVTRARVELRVEVDDGSESVTVFSATHAVRDANRWHEARVDLTRFSGRDVSLTFAALPAGGEESVLWSSRVQVVWGQPRLRSGSGPPVESTLGDVLERASQLGPVGSTSHLDFVINLVLAGLLSLVPVGGFRTFPAIVRIFFTLAATLMVAVVHSSVALSLGLLGALSILRFRTQVRTGTELLHLLFCVALALGFGTNQRPLAIAGAITYVSFAIAASTLRKARGRAGAGETTSRSFRFAASGRNGEGLKGRLESLTSSGRVHSLDVDSAAGTLSFDARIPMGGFREIAEFMTTVHRQAPRLRVTLRTAQNSRDVF